MKNKKARIDHINFSIKNFDESVRWYQDIFNFELVEEGESEGIHWGILKNGENMLALSEYPGKDLIRSNDIHKIYHFGIRLVDRMEWEETINKHMLKTFYGSPIDHPHSTSWYIQDPTGHEIEVSIWDNDEVRF